MKKTIAFLLMLLLLFSCSACGKDDQRTKDYGLKLERDEEKHENISGE